MLTHFSSAHRLRPLTGLLFSILVLLGLAGTATAQAGRWTAHTSMRDVTSISSGGDVMWVGTTGGVFSYDLSSGEIRRFTIVEGLYGIQVRAIKFDPVCATGQPCVWIGYQDGVIDRLHPETGSVETFRDVARADRFPRREINRFELRGDSVLISTGFGLVVFSAERREVEDSYTQFSAIVAGTAVHDALVGPDENGVDRLWVATDSGVASAAVNSPNLKDPASWTVEQSGLPSIEARSLAIFNGRLYVGTTAGLAARQAGGTYMSTGVTGTTVSDLVATDDRLLGLDASALLAVESSGAGRRLPSQRFSQPSALEIGPQGDLWIGDRLEGLVDAGPVTASSIEPAVERTFFPEGPYHNSFSRLTVDEEGNLWAAGVIGPSGSGFGFYRRGVDGVWTDFIGRTLPVLRGRESFVSIHADAEGRVWAGSIGRAVAMVDENDEVHIVDAHNSSLVGPSDTSFIMIGGIGSDPQGNLWVVSHASPRPLNVRTADGQWTNFGLHSCGGLTAGQGTYERMFVDSYGQLWFDVKSTANLNTGIGLLVVNPGRTPTDVSDDACRYFGSLGVAGSGMPGLEVLGFAEDKTGLMWVATDKGLAYFINNGLVAHDPASTPIWPQYADRSQGVFLFQGLKINDVAVDPANQVWVATDAGAYLIRQVGSGFEQVEHWTSENSPLLSDVVEAVTVEPESGEVFFATDRGLVSYQGEAIAASTEARDLIVYPNPVRVGPDEEPAIFIQGLVDETEIFILAPQGTVVTRFMARGGRARWDGRDQSGRLVPSGMYLVVAIGQNGEERAFGKVGVVR